MQGRGGRLVGLVVGTSLLAACTGGGGGAEEGASEAPSSSPSSPVVSSSSEAAVPALPDEARGDDDAAAVAFVEHWVELVNYAIATGDTGPARSLSTSCEVCDQALAPVDAGELEQDQWVISSPEAVPPLAEDADRTDLVVRAEVTAGDGSGTFVFGLTKTADAWQVSWAGGYE